MDKKLKEKTREDAKKITLIKKIVVPDTSIIIQGTISKMLKEKKISFKKILIHEAVISELESQANKGKETGYLGLDEISLIRQLSKKYNFEIEFTGARPGDFEIKFAKAGEIDSLIRDLAIQNDATLLTADLVQGKVSLAKGLSVIIYDVLSEEKDSLMIEQYFTKDAMSIHLREGCTPSAKIGVPGSWKYKEISKKILTKENLEAIHKELIEYAKTDTHSFFESDKKNSTVLQIKNMRIVIVKPPLSDAFEITAVRPVSKLTLNDYKLEESLKTRLLQKAEGLLVAGPPGHGKSTFVQCLGDTYASLNKSVKTLESPRDLVVNKTITRYGSSQAQHSEIRDVLLLSRPDFVLFDEVRNIEDFRLFSDLRLSGIGMLGVIHAAEPIDAVQRFIGRLDLGVIPHVLDTVVFVYNGKIEKVFSLSMSVKVPAGMFEADLARPVILINDFYTGKLEYEVYSYGEEAVVVPVNTFSNKKSVYTLAEKYLLQEIKELDVSDACIEFITDNKCIIYVAKKDLPLVIGPKGSVVSAMQKKYKLKIDVSEKKTVKNPSKKEQAKYNYTINAKHIVFDLDKKYQDTLVSIFIETDFIMNVKTSKKAQIKIAIESPNGQLINRANEQKKELKIYTT